MFNFEDSTFSEAKSTKTTEESQSSINITPKTKIVKINVEIQSQRNENSIEFKEFTLPMTNDSIRKNVDNLNTFQSTINVKEKLEQKPDKLLQIEHSPAAVKSREPPILYNWEDTSSFSPLKKPSTPRKRKTKIKFKPKSNANLDVFKEFLNRETPVPITNDSLPRIKSSKDNLAHFFDAIADTMRSFPPLSIAKTKLQISKIVGEEEIALATASNFQIID